MGNEQPFHPGAYARILDEDLADFLKRNPELRAVLRKLEEEEEPHQYAALLAQLLQIHFAQSKPAERVNLLNRIIELLSDQQADTYIQRRRVLDDRKMLTSLHTAAPIDKPWPTPQTALNASYLFTGSGDGPSLDHELRQEMGSADRIDILVSFIKHSGLRLLMAALEETAGRNVPIRVITTY